MCLLMWALWQHPANTIEPVLALAQPSPQCKRQIDRLAQLTAEKVPILTTGSSFP